MYKLLLSWDIRPGRNQEYSEFMMREFVPGLNRMGLTPSEAWLSVYGEGPQIMMEAAVEELEMVHEVLASAQWRELQDKLEEYVDGYQQKVVRTNRGFQI
ncbi:MAG: hypothetical protein K8S97_00375 [Anaerolineae bacterium]|nr:hypothetical protein [Anaerolineae bacterium]